MEVMRVQLASDVAADTMSLELWDQDDVLRAEVRRSDGDGRVTFVTYGREIDLALVQQFVDLAVARLGPFENGRPLGQALVQGSLQFNSGEEP
jgi:hypothetical protein